MNGSGRGQATSAAARQPSERRGAVSIKALTKSFGSTPVLRGVDLTVSPGEFVTILGPSGCGKSTLMRIIAGLEHQDAGSIAIDGVPVDGMRPSARNIAMVFQSYALYPHMSVRDNIKVPLRMRRLSFGQRLPGARLVSPAVRAVDRQIEAAVGDVATLLQLEALLERKPGQLSGGQKQRVALGRAMVREPWVFLMDEPLSNLDAELRVHMRAEIVQLHRRLGVTFIYVTHDQAEAMTMSDRVVVMMGGVPLQVAPPETIYDRPADLTVARFVGSPRINVVEGVVDRDGIVVFGKRLPLRTGLPDGTRVQFGIRPNRARLSGAGDTPAVSGRITHRENLGSDLFLYVRAEGADEPIIVRHDSAGAGRFTIGDTVDVTFPVEHALLFDAAGRRIDASREALSGEPVHA